MSDETGKNEVEVIKDSNEGEMTTNTVEKEVNPNLSFFVENSDKIRVTVDVLFDKSNGKIVGYFASGKLNDDLKEFAAMYGVSNEWFEFTSPGYGDVSAYRQKCSIYDEKNSKIVVNQEVFRQLLLTWHLKDWSLKGKDGKKINLTTTKDGTLDTKSLALIGKCSDILINLVMEQFEAEAFINKDE